MTRHLRLLSLFLGLSVSVLLPAGGCNGQPAGALTDLIAQSDAGDLLLLFNNLPGTSTIASIADSQSHTTMNVSGDKSLTGAAQEITGVTGTTMEGESFELTFADGVPTSLTIGGEYFEFVQLDDTTFDVVDDIDASKGLTAQRWTISTSLYDSTLTALEAYSDCLDQQCPDQLRRTLMLVGHLAYFEALADSLFNERCLDTDEYSGAQCRNLLDFVATLGRTIDEIIADSPDLPAEIRALCFGLREDCDTLVYTPQSPLFSDPESSADPDVTVEITGPTELAAGELGAFTASASGAIVSYSWDLLGSPIATLTYRISNEARVLAASTSGTVTLVVEARQIGTGRVLATATYTISIEGVPPREPDEYVAWYDPENTCWDAPSISVSLRTYFASQSGSPVEMQGGFATEQEARDWVCSQVQSRFQHAWCGSHMNIGGTYFRVPYWWNCDYSNAPWEN